MKNVKMGMTISGIIKPMMNLDSPQIVGIILTQENE